jgi:hypothetical protein
MLAVVLVGNRDMILETIHENWLNALGVALFVVIGLGVLYAAIRMTFTKKISGWAVFKMDSVPGVIGGKLEGSIATRIPPYFDKVVTLKLAGTSSAPFEKKVLREQMREGPKGLAIPVEFDIPNSCEGTSEWNPDHKVIWTLKALANLDDGKWEVSFDVPVFKLPEPEA